MRFLTNYHTHSDLCDGKDSLEEMAEAACKAGLSALGFTGHSYTAYDDWYCMSKEGTKEYIRRVRKLKEEYKGRMNILLGIEQDFGSDEPTDEYDYVIGSVHVVFPRCGEYCNIHELYGKNLTEEEKSRLGCKSYNGYDRSHFYYTDWTPEKLRKDIHDHFNDDPYSFAELYYEMVSKLPEVTNCDIVGHFDLLTKFNEKDRLFDTSNPRYKRAWNMALDELLKRDLIFEINTGAVTRGYRTEPYPADYIIKRLAEENAKFVINSDAHSKEAIVGGFEQAYKIAEKYRINLVTL